MQIYEAARRSLEEIGKPTHLSDLRRHIEDQGYYEFGAQVPERALGVAVDRHARGVQIPGKVEPTLFFRASPATYGLLEWLSDEALSRVDADDAEGLEEPTLDASLFLEKELHRWLYKNLEENGLVAMGLGHLSLFDHDGQCESDGKYFTPVGEIDMLLKQPNGDLVVVELKRSSNDATVGQICRYFSWVREKLADGQKVLGVILALGANERLRYALRATDPNIYYQEIEIDVRLGERTR